MQEKASRTNSKQCLKWFPVIYMKLSKQNFHHVNRPHNRSMWLSAKILACRVVIHLSFTNKCTCFIVPFLKKIWIISSHLVPFGCWTDLTGSLFISQMRVKWNIGRDFSCQADNSRLLLPVNKIACSSYFSSSKDMRGMANLFCNFSVCSPFSVYSNSV